MSSVLINFNKNLQNGEAYKFSQFYDDVVNIPENATVSLNNVQLTRKAINISEDSTITLNLNTGRDNSQNLDLSRTFDNKREAVNGDYRVNDISFILSKGSYSKREFLNELYTKCNQAITNYNLDPLRNECPYSALISNTNDKAVFGLALDYPKVGFEFHNEFRMTNNMTFDSSNIALFPTSVGTISPTDFNTFSFAQSAYNPLNFDSDNIEQSSLTFGLFDKDTSGSLREYFVCFTNQVQASAWSSNTVMDKETLEDGTQVPRAWIGFLWDNNPSSPTSATLTIYQSSNLATMNNERWHINADLELGNMVLVNSLRFDDVIENQRYAIQFYQENDYNASDEEKIRNYYRLLAINIDTITEDLLQPENNVLFDSKVFGKSISSDLVGRNFKIDDLGANHLPSGLVPVFGMRNISGTGQFDQGFYDIQAPFINKVWDSSHKLDQTSYFGIGYYSVTVPENIANVFGDTVNTKMNPNGLTNEKYHTADFAISQFYQDDTVYNIEVNNLPIKTYQSTTSSNVNVNIGSKRPIVFKANSLFNGKVDNLNSSRIVRTHYENFNKLLKLKNKYKTERNQLDISVRRAKTNELATEITDCSLELTIDTE